MALILPAAVLKAIVDAAEAAYPRECCGLLVGRVDRRGNRLVGRRVASPNVAPDGGFDRFEVDPAVRFAVMRELGAGPEAVVGHYHSHPDHPARPSAADLAMAWEPDLVWLIVAVHGGQAIQATAHRPSPDGREFRRLALRTI